MITINQAKTRANNDHSDRPELQLGFPAWRRKEILDFAKKYSDVIGVIDENTAKDDLIKMMESFKMQGKFSSPPDKARDAEIESLTSRLAALESKTTADNPAEEKRGIVRSKAEKAE
jgi:hypothetical protein